MCMCVGRQTTLNSEGKSYVWNIASVDVKSGIPERHKTFNQSNRSLAMATSQNFRNLNSAFFVTDSNCHFVRKSYSILGIAQQHQSFEVELSHIRIASRRETSLTKWKRKRYKYNITIDIEKKTSKIPPLSVNMVINAAVFMIHHEHNECSDVNHLITPL